MSIYSDPVSLDIDETVILGNLEAVCDNSGLQKSRLEVCFKMNFPGLLQVGELLEPCFNCLKAYLQTRSPYFLELVEEKPLKPFPSGRTKIIVKDF